MIKYRDYIYKRLVTEQQAILLDFYEKIYYVDNEVKKIEIFRNFVLRRIIYYLDATEDLNAVLNNRENGVHWSINSNKQISGDYLSYESRGYNENNEVNFLSKTVVRISTGFEVARINYNVETLLPEGAIKVLDLSGRSYIFDGRAFDFNSDSEIYISFNENNEIDDIGASEDVGSDNQNGWYDVNDFLVDIAYLIESCLLEGELEYYINVLPLVPDF